MPTIKVRALVAKGHPRHSSRRTVGEVEGIFRVANEIWSHAGIRLDATVLEWRFDEAGLDEIVESARLRMGDCGRIAEINGYDPRGITVLYVGSIGGSNGKVFRPKKAVLVVDNTTMSDARTTAHEIGHLFGLKHWLESPPPALPDRPPNQLMARTQPGTELTPRDVATVKKNLPSCGLDAIP